MSVCRCAVCLSAGRSGFRSVVDGGGDESIKHVGCGVVA